MSTIADIVVGITAALHIGFLVMEMFLWDTPLGLRITGLTPAAAATSKVLAANQGLYNGFLAAGLIWGLALGAGGAGVKVFFLSCALVAGVFGGITASRNIFLVQGVPAAIGLALVLLA